MLSIARVAHGQEGYYLDLSSEDYYLEGGEPPGLWVGDGTELLGLRGIVEKQQLGNLFDGLRPDGEGALTQQQHYEDGRSKRPGWDLTFSAPKSVSVVWALSDQATRKRIQDAHHGAVKAALSYLEENATFTRRGKGGQTAEQGKLVAAVFEHGTSRAQDPQLHSHALLANIVACSDGAFRTLRSLDLYQHKMAAGAFYRAALAHALAEQLHFEFEKVKTWFEVKGVPGYLTERFSKRRQDIEAALAESGRAGPKASEFFTLSTREVKAHVAREELFAAWKREGQEFRPELLSKTLPGVENPVPGIRKAVRGAIDELIKTHSHFAERDLVRAALERLQHLGVSPRLVQDVVRAHLQDPDRIICVGERADYARFTTPEMFRVEKSMLEVADGLNGRDGHAVGGSAVASALKARPTIRDEQREALRHILENGDLKAVVGMAGTGKTYLLDAARDAWEAVGYRVLGTSLAAKAARGLEKASGIESMTIAKLFVLLDAEEKGLGVGGKNTRRPLLDNKTVLVVDEAGMVDTRKMERLLLVVEKSGAKLVLVGDHGQLQPIDAGGPFCAIVERFGAAHLKDITRQREEWMREAVHEFARGDSRAALSKYAERGFLHFSKDKETATQTLIDHWDKERTSRLTQTLIIAGTNAEVDALNSKAQEARVRARELDEKKAAFVGKLRLMPGDVVVFTKNDRTLKVLNGDFGVVERIEAVGRMRALLTVRLDDGEGAMSSPGAARTAARRVLVNPDEYEHLRLGYAVTTHKVQGATIEKAFLLVGGSMQDRELSYVEASRAKHVTRIFATEGVFDEDVEELARAMARSRQKDLAHTVAFEQEEERLALESSRVNAVAFRSGYLRGLTP